MKRKIAHLNDVLYNEIVKCEWLIPQNNSTHSLTTHISLYI